MSKAADDYNSTEALRVLAEAYIRLCTANKNLCIPIGTIAYRTLIIFDSGVWWMRRLAKEGGQLSEKARAHDGEFVVFISELSPSVPTYLYEGFEKTDKGPTEYKKYWKEFVDDTSINDKLKEIVCWGLCRMGR